METHPGIPILRNTGFQQVVMATCNPSGKPAANTRESIDLVLTRGGVLPQELFHQRFQKIRCALHQHAQLVSRTQRQNPRPLFHFKSRGLRPQFACSSESCKPVAVQPLALRSLFPVKVCETSTTHAPPLLSSTTPTSTSNTTPITIPILTLNRVFRSDH